MSRRNSTLGSMMNLAVRIREPHLGVGLGALEALAGPNADKYHPRIAAALKESIAPPPSLDTIVRVDRSVRPTYPDWVKEVKHPELECTGPAEFDLANLEQWLHDGQQGGGYVTGNAIYDHLKANGMLESCLSLQDGLAIQQKGIEAFRFGGKAGFLWRSVVLRRGGGLDVPYLYGSDGRVMVDWDFLARGWYGHGPALRLAS